MKQLRLFKFAMSAILAGVFLTGCAFPEYGVVVDYASARTERAKLVMPPNAPSISQQFRLKAAKDLSGQPTGEHFGIDIRAHIGTPVLAAAPGKVIASYYEPMYGNHLVIEHATNGARLRMQTQHLHLQQRMVRVGDRVVRGQQIATLGASGVLAGGLAHLHFEVHRETRKRIIKPADPHLFWAGGIGRITCFDPKNAKTYGPRQITYPVACQ